MHIERSLTLGARHWDHLVPLSLGDIAGSESIVLERRESTPHLWAETALDAAETSFSSYVRARAAGDRSVTALPVFIMRGFRHRCILTRKDSPFETGADLRGARIGLTGWPDSGNTWTRAVLRREGVGVPDAEWRVGALTSAHPVHDRFGGVLAPENVAATENDEPLIDMLERGALDAVMTPFMPRGFSHPDSPLRTLFRNTQQVEEQYFSETGYIPGIHLLAVKTEALERDPEKAQLLVDALSQSQDLSRARREKLLDVTPWQNLAFALSDAVVGDDFSPIGLDRNRSMIADFQSELVEQGLMPVPLREADLFPLPIEPTLLQPMYRSCSASSPTTAHTTWRHS